MLVLSRDGVIRHLLTTPLNLLLSALISGGSPITFILLLRYLRHLPPYFRLLDLGALLAIVLEHVGVHFLIELLGQLRVVDVVAEHHLQVILKLLLCPLSSNLCRLQSHLILPLHLKYALVDIGRYLAGARSQQKRRGVLFDALIYDVLLAFHLDIVILRVILLLFSKPYFAAIYFQILLFPLQTHFLLSINFKYLLISICQNLRRINFSEEMRRLKVTLIFHLAIAVRVV